MSMYLCINKAVQCCIRMTDAERWLKSFQHCRTWCYFTNKSHRHTFDTFNRHVKNPNFWYIV